MNKLMEIVVYILAAIGLACVVKHIRITNCKEGCCFCNLFDTKVEESKTRTEDIKTRAEEIKTKVEGIKTKVEESKTRTEGIKTKVGEINTKIQKFKTKEKEEKRTGSRYGSNPVKY
ncbi:MAG: hypothetical protein QM426_07305 [Euryarchaeota archaeon]|nr:hypothetical protein [Euryarchaeota archaeon]